jgi:hypothetical protein
MRGTPTDRSAHRDASGQASGVGPAHREKALLKALASA